MRIKLTIAFLLLAGYTGILFSQTISNPHFTHLTTQNGLSNNWVNCIAQDKTGFIWIGTQDGLNRYDSRHFKIYKHNPKNNNSLPNNNITGIAFDKNGLTWVGTNKGLCSIDPLTDSVTRYKNISGQPASLSNNLYVRPFIDSNNDLWIGTNNGLNYFNRNTKSFSTFFLSKPEEAGSQTFSNSIQKIIEDDKKNIWCLGQYKISFFDKKNAQLISYATPLTGINWDVVQKNAGTFYISQWAGGLYEFDIETKKFKRLSINSPFNVFISLFFDKDVKGPTLYIGSNESGVTVYDPVMQKQSAFRHSNYQSSSIIADQVFQIFKDREESLWFAGSRGISILNPQMQLFKNLILGDNFYPGEAEKFGRVNLFFESGENKLLNAWPYTGLYEFDKNWKFNKKQLRVPPGSKSFHSQLINYIHAENNITWFCTDSGLVKYNTIQNSYKVFIPPRIDSSVHKEHIQIRKILPLGEDGFIVRTWKWGILLFDKKREKFSAHFQHNKNDTNSVADVHTFDMISTASGEIYISTPNGLCLYMPDRKYFITYKASAGTDNSVAPMKRMCTDAAANLWVTSESGLFYFNTKTKKFSHYTTLDGLPMDRTNRVCTDKKGNVWITTNVGITRFDPVEKKVLNFSLNNGLPAELYEGTLLLMKDGNILAGFEGGVTIINPESYPYNKEMPAVLINEIKTGNEKISYNLNTENEKIISLSHRQNSVQLSFSVLNFTSPQQNSFYYLLEGFNKDWQLSADGNVNYTNLAPGNYILKVKGANNSGVMNETGDKIIIRIKPALWQTRWFRISVGLLLLGSAVWFFRKRIQAVRHEAELKQKIAETEMMALRAQMNPHFIFNSLNSIDNLIQTDQKEKATTYLARFAKLIRGILENSKQEVISCWKDLELLQLYLELEKLRWDNKFSSDLKIDDRIIHGDYKVPPLVVQPFVENAIHHGLLNKTGEDRKLFISVKPENGQIKYIIEDNGVGRAKAEEYKKMNRPSHLSMGLNITEQRINLFNKTDTGSVNITDLTGNENEVLGTRVEIILNNQV